MALDLIKRAENGAAPLSAAQYDATLTAIEDEVNGLSLSGPGRWTELIYPEDFGANPNGSFTGNAAAINSAITAASTYTVAGQRRGGRVQLSRGTYLINSTIQLKSLTELCGVSPTATTIEVASGANCRAIQTVDGDQILYGVRDFGVYGNASGQAADDGSPGGDRGGVYLINAKAEPTAIGQYRFLGGCRSWARHLLIQEVAGNGLFVQGNSDWMVHNIHVRWTGRYGFYLDANDASFSMLNASRTGWAGLFFDGANSRISQVKVWFCGVEMHRWKTAKDWAQANDTTLYNRQFNDNEKAGCGILSRGDNTRFSLIDVQDTAGHGMYVHSRRNWIDGITTDQIGQVNAGGTTTRYDGGGAGAFDWVDLNPGKPLVGVLVFTNLNGYLRAHVYDITYNDDGTTGGGTIHDALKHLVWNKEPDMELAVTGSEEIPQRLTGIPVKSASPYRLNGAAFSANI